MTELGRVYSMLDAGFVRQVACGTCVDTAHLGSPVYLASHSIEGRHSLSFSFV